MYKFTDVKTIIFDSDLPDNESSKPTSGSS